MATGKQLIGLLVLLGVEALAPQWAVACEGSGLAGSAAICSPSVRGNATVCLTGGAFEQAIEAEQGSHVAEALPPPSSTYRQQEFFFSGQAVSYASCGVWHNDGIWSTHIKPPAAFVSRMLVRVPKDAAAFNGTVIVEWLNTTFGFDVGVDASYGAEALAKGFAWVGVSAAIEDALPNLATHGYARLDPVRYAAIIDGADAKKTPNSWAGNTAYGYDIFTQAAKLLRQRPDVLLGGPMMKPQILIAAGQSRSAMHLVTYANAIQPQSRAFDGFLIHGRPAVGQPINFGLADLLNTPLQARIRQDIPAKVLQLQSEMDVMTAFGWTARQPDSARVRTWEVAGASHFDETMNDAVAQIVARNAVAAQDKQKPVCDQPRFNSLPFYRVEKAAWHMLHDWIRGAEQRYISPEPLRVVNGSLQRDPITGNALGGVRLPELAAPLMQYAMNNHGASGQYNKSVPSFNATVCNISGSSTDLSSDQLKRLYSNQSDYLARYAAAARAAQAAGVLLQEDADKGMAEAMLKAQSVDH